MDAPLISAWATHPSVNPAGRYKFTSANLYLDPRVLAFNRQTYDFLGWLGDIGGLIDAIYIILKIIMLPITTFNLKRFLLTIMFRLVPSTQSLAKENYKLTDNKLGQEESDLAKVLRNSTAVKLIHEDKND